MTKAKYQEYLKSERWMTLREAKLTQAGHRCQLCNDGVKDANLQCHHRTYENINGSAEFTDLVVLCDKCHATQHGKSEDLPLVQKHNYDRWIRDVVQLDLSDNDFLRLMATVIMRRHEHREENPEGVD